MFLISHLRAVLGAALVALSVAGSPLAQAQTPAPAASAPAAAAPAAAPAAVAPAAPVASAAAPKNGEALDNPYGIEALWKGSDLIARSVLVLLAIMSVGSWYILVVKLLEQTKMTRQARTVEKKFWDAKSVREAANALEKNSAYRFIAEAGANATTDHGGLKTHIPMNEWIPMSITAAVDRVQASTQKGLAFLATVGSTSPFVGLFGTVWGIMNSFGHIAVSKNTSLAVVAPGISEALFATAIGLVAAIPAAGAYNILSGHVARYAAQLEAFAGEFITILSRQLEEQG